MQELTDDELNAMSGLELEAAFVAQMVMDRTEQIKEDELPASAFSDLRRVFEGKEKLTNEQYAVLLEKMEDEVAAELMSVLPDYLLKRLNDKIDSDEITEDEYNEIMEEAGIDRDTVTRNVMLDFRRRFFQGEYDELLTAEKAAEDEKEKEAEDE